MKKQDIPKLTNLDQLPNFNSIESRVFTEYKGNVYIGKDKIKPDMRELLSDQAKWLKTSQLYEVLRATILNEASQLALIQSKEWDHVISAKMLYHWQFVLDNLIKKLTD